MRRSFSFGCVDCGNSWTLSRGDLYDGDPPTTVCKGCEGEFCWRCYRRHDCGWHEPETAYCQGCGEDIELAEETPVKIEGDDYHKKCAAA